MGVFTRLLSGVRMRCHSSMGELKAVALTKEHPSLGETAQETSSPGLPASSANSSTGLESFLPSTGAVIAYLVLGR